MEAAAAYEILKTGSPWAFVFFLGWFCYRLISDRFVDLQKVTALLTKADANIADSVQVAEAAAASNAALADALNKCTEKLVELSGRLSNLEASCNRMRDTVMIQSGKPV